MTIRKSQDLLTFWNKLTGMQSYSETIKLMGNMFSFCAMHQNQSIAHVAVSEGISEVRRIEKLLTSFSENSITAEINRNAGFRPVTVTDEVFDLIQRSIKISDITQDAFDISYGSADKRFWNFDKNMTSLPNPKNAIKNVRLVDYRNIIINREDSTVLLKNRGMRIGFGGIGKGYAAERAKYMMKKMGIENGIVNAAGDLTTWGHQENGEAWTIGIADPNHKSKLFSSISISDKSVATSGDYEKYVVIGDVRYSHTIDPKTGMPAKGMKSVTVICSNAELADALTTPIIIMGWESGLHMVNQLNGVEAIIINNDNKMYFSNNINVLK